MHSQVTTAVVDRLREHHLYQTKRLDGDASGLIFNRYLEFLRQAHAPSPRAPMRRIDQGTVQLRRFHKHREPHWRSLPMPPAERRRIKNSTPGRQAQAAFV